MGDVASARLDARNKVTGRLSRLPGVRRLMVCLHPSWRDCQYHSVKGKYGWWTRCNQCGIYRTCTPA